MLQRSKASYAEGQKKTTILQKEYQGLCEKINMLEQEYKLWKGKNSDIRSKLDYIMQLNIVN